MPTARPSMRASSGVVEETVAKPVAPKISATVRPTPSSAVSSGMPAARSEPRVSQSTIRATSTPTPSLQADAGGAAAEGVAADRDLRAGQRGLQLRALVLRARRRSSGRCRPAATLSVTVMIAALRSSETCPLAYLSNGPDTESTCGTSPEALGAGVDRLLRRGRADRLALARDHDDLGGGAAGLRERALQGVERGLRLGAREREVLVEALAHHGREAPEDDEDGQPGQHDTKAVPVGGATEAIEEGGHLDT